MRKSTPQVNMRLAVLAAMALSAIVVFAEEPRAPMLRPEEYPRIDGSTSSQPLGTLVACRLTHTSFAWGSHPLDGTRRLYPTMEPYDPAAKLSLDFPDARHYMPTKIQGDLFKRIEHTGTHESYTNLIARTADLIIAAREPSGDELALARQKGVRIRFAPVALDAFVFLVNRNNPITSLTVEQIRAIYAGTLTNWSAVGGPTEPITPYQRNRNSGSQETMEKLVMKGLTMIQPRDLEVAMSMVGPFNAIRHNRNGIGYTFQYYDTYMTRIPEVTIIAINGIQPTPERIGKRAYPFVAEVFLAWLDGLPTPSPAQAVRDFLISEAGQRVVAESGYVPITYQ
jgi:phosphate transport system substrate-binding protein